MSKTGIEFQDVSFRYEGQNKENIKHINMEKNYGRLAFPCLPFAPDCKVISIGKQMVKCNRTLMQ